MGASRTKMFGIKRMLAIFGMFVLMLAGIGQIQAHDNQADYQIDKFEPKICRIVTDTLMGKVVCYVDCKNARELLKKVKDKQHETNHTQRK